MDRAKIDRTRKSALEKALVVLNAVTNQPQPIGLPDLSDRVGLPRQTAHRILGQLEKAGLITRSLARDRFMVGLHLTELALAALLSDNQSAPVHNVLAKLVDDVQETCNIGLLRGMEIIYLDRIECDWDLRIHLAVGSKIPAHCTGSGKVMLAHLPADLRERLLASAKLTPQTEKSITDVAVLEEVLAEVREQGYALNVDEFIIGVASVSVPVFDRSGRVLAALTMHGPMLRVSAENAIKRVPRLKAAARELAQIWNLAD